jgi:hypothetical protein
MSSIGVAVRRLGVVVLIGGWVLTPGNPLVAGTVEPRFPGPIVVTTTSELEAALSPSNAGREIRVRAGTYDLSHALVVPEDASVLGEGVMLVDESRLPYGFDPAGRTVLRATSALVGDIVTLGNGAVLRGLTIEDVSGRSGGNLVVVSSRAAGDSVASTIVECELINPNPSGVGAQGPTGRALLAITRNLNLGSNPPPHEASVIAVRMSDSIVRAPAGGSGVFAINFASRSEVNVDLTRNVIGGNLDASGAASRPDGVAGAETVIESRFNLYRSDTAVPGPTGWLLHGGTDAPVAGLVPSATNSNVLRLRSIADRIEGFATAISATAGRRVSALAGGSSTNEIHLDMLGTVVQSTVADFALFGARSLVNGVSPGDGNALRVWVRAVQGSGTRANQYAHSLTPLMDSLGLDNRLEVVASPTAFARSNIDIEPGPGDEFFSVFLNRLSVIAR